jgi:hypothetical protein
MAELGVVGPLGFEGRPHGDCIATSADFYAAIFPFFVFETWLGWREINRSSEACF